MDKTIAADIVRERHVHKLSVLDMVCRQHWRNKRTVLRRGNALCQVQCASRVFKIAENQKFSQDGLEDDRRHHSTVLDVHDP